LADPVAVLLGLVLFLFPHDADLFVDYLGEGGEAAWVVDELQELPVEWEVA
jgi:hypothetical protein